MTKIFLFAFQLAPPYFPTCPASGASWKMGLLSEKSISHYIIMQFYALFL